MEQFVFVSNRKNGKERRALGMMVSTKGRYALTVMVDLARLEGDGYVSLADIAERENLSMKYLESILMNTTSARYCSLPRAHLHLSTA